MYSIHTMNNYITARPFNDGFGSQFQTLLYAIIFSFYDEKEFVYTPLNYVEHNYKDDPNFNENLENLMNIRTHFKNIGDFDENERNNIISYEIPPIKDKMDANIKQFMTETTLKRIRAMFWGNKERDYFKNGKVNVAIHIRRPNEYDETILEEYQKQMGYFQRFNTNEYFLNVINNIRNKHAEKELRFHIYSQSNIRSNFDCFIREDTELHIDEDICSTFMGLAAADILVTSASSFSYVAGLLNFGTVVYCPFWHPPAPGWVTI